MKKLLLAVVSFLLIVFSVTAQNGNEWRKFNPVTPLTAATFAHPPAIDLPYIPATADPAEIKVEVKQLYESGMMQPYGLVGPLC